MTGPVPKQSATLANVVSSATSVALFAASGSARERTVFNDGTTTMLLSFSATASSATAFTVKIAAAGYYEFPQPLYAGAVTAIWEGSPTGAARTTEY